LGTNYLKIRLKNQELNTLNIFITTAYTFREFFVGETPVTALNWLEKCWLDEKPS